jgi:putative FmdB family regulatory protein
MPLYEYQCDACGQRFEKIHQKFSDPPVEICPKCGKGPVKKLLSSPAIQFKGSGWYVTDYAKKPSTDGGKTTDASSTQTTAETPSPATSSSETTTTKTTPSKD